MKALETADEKKASLRAKWPRIADYLFGRNALIGMASFMLLLISGYATWHGMRDFIVGVASCTAVEHTGGLSMFSKAQRALDISGWSETARKDVEVFRLDDCEGLTPLLTLLNEETLAKGADSLGAARLEQAEFQNERKLQIVDQRRTPMLSDSKGT